MRQPALAVATVVILAALVACGGGARSADAPAAGKGGKSAPVAQPAKPAAEPAAPAPVAAPAAPVAAEPAAPTAKPADATAAKAINTICPVTGLAVDPSIPAVEVLVDVVSPPQVMLIGVSNAEAAKRVAANPERFAAAARNNREARDPRNPASGPGQR